jgi:uncharacterized membrane protein
VTVTVQSSLEKEIVYRMKSKLSWVPGCWVMVVVALSTTLVSKNAVDVLAVAAIVVTRKYI